MGIFNEDEDMKHRVRSGPTLLGAAYSLELLVTCLAHELENLPRGPKELANSTLWRTIYSTEGPASTLATMVNNIMKVWTLVNGAALLT